MNAILISEFNKYRKILGHKFAVKLLNKNTCAILFVYEKVKRALLFIEVLVLDQFSPAVFFKDYSFMGG